MCTVYQMEGKWNTCTEVNSYAEGVKHSIRENLLNSVAIAGIHGSLLKFLKTVMYFVYVGDIRLYVTGFLLPRKELKYCCMDLITLFCTYKYSRNECFGCICSLSPFL